MSESDSFIQEVQEEVRQDRMFALWKKWGPFVIAGVVLIVGAAAAWSWIQAREKAAAEALGDRFLAAGESDVAAQEALVAEAGPEAAVLARLALAAAQAEAGETEAARALFTEIAEDASLTREYSDLARLQAIRLQAESAPAEALTALGFLTGSEGPYRLLAVELAAVLKLNTGDVDGARTDLTAIMVDPGATEALRTRVVALMATIGDAGPAEDG